jgi:signal transduction histidine kinase/ligand-binding sensor domain-containing protein/CheY-like chemotaxis protein
MCLKMKLFIVNLFLLLHLSAAFSQVDKPNFKRFSTKEGLSNNWVRCIYQDNKGFLWFGTADGLNRYDGYGFKVFRLINDDKTSLGDIHINAILEKNNHQLWVCTDMGVYTFDLESEKGFTNPLLKPLSVICAIIDTHKNTWFGTSNGLFRYNPADSSITSFTHKNDNSNSLSSDYINTLFLDSEGNVWAGTKKGLNFFNSNTQTFASYSANGMQGSISGNDVMGICEDKFKRLWVGTSQDGVNLVKKSSDRVLYFHQVLDGYIMNLISDFENNIWIARGSGGGLVKIALGNSLDNSTINPVIYHTDPTNPKSISDNSIYSIFEDKAKDIWIGTFGGGVNYFSKREKKFFSISFDYSAKSSLFNNLVNAICDDEKYLWIGTEAGLDRYDKTEKTFKHFSYNERDKTSMSVNPVYSLLRDSKDNLWVGTWAGGLNLYNNKTQTFKHFQPDEKEGSISNGNIFSIFEDSKRNLWIGTIGGGLNRYNYKTSKFEHFLKNESDTGSLYYNFVNCILESKTGRLYISTYFSLEIFDYETGKFTHCLFNKKISDNAGQIISIFQDSKNHIWIASNKGLSIFDESEMKFNDYDIEGMPDNTIQAILEDNHHNIWISTNNGLVQIIQGALLPKDPVIRNYSVTDGLPGNEFKKRSAIKNSSGILYFGSANGVVYFNPDSIEYNTIAPPVVLTGFQLLSLQKDDNLKFKSILQNINSVELIDLPYNNSNFIIWFSSLNFLNSENNKFLYKLEGYDDNWIDAGTRHSATYTNLKPGSYNFQVKGSNNDGVWCNEPAKLEIIIHPPWWGTLLFRIFMVLVIIITLISIHFIRLSILKGQNTLLEKKVKDRTNDLTEMNTLLEERQEEITIQNDELERHRSHLEQLVEERTVELVSAKIKAEESDRLKSSFLANMSHEIRTPMNAIYGFSGLLNADDLSKEDKSQYINIINENCESLLVLIDDILDISRIEVDHLVFTNEKYIVDDVLVNLESFFKHNNNKQLTIEFFNKNSDHKLILNNDKVRFRQVFTNLFNNAYKFTDTGYIRFGYEVIKDYVRFYVSDTGIGIESSEMERIFNHFYKIENSFERLYAGTGLGLAISKKLIEMMGGEIWVESTVGKGSIFYFTLPSSTDNASGQEKENKIEQKKRNLQYITILVAEDTPTNYELVRSMLKPFGAEIVWVQNGLEAVEFVRYHAEIENCIILMDIKMPLLDGYEAMKQIKVINNKIPIIAVTAYAQKDDKEKMLSSGFDDYLAKPIKIELLINTLVKHSDSGKINE